MPTDRPNTIPIRPNQAVASTPDRFTEAHRLLEASLQEFCDGRYYGEVGLTATFQAGTIHTVQQIRRRTVK